MLTLAGREGEGREGRGEEGLSGRVVFSLL